MKELCHELTAQNVDDQSWVLERVKEEHVAEGPVGEGRTEDRDLVLGRPVVDGGLVVDLEPKPGDDF